MVHIEIVWGTHKTKMTLSEFEQMLEALEKMVKWDVGGMFGDGEEITDKKGLQTARKTLKKFGIN